MAANSGYGSKRNLYPNVLEALIEASAKNREYPETYTQVRWCPACRGCHLTTHGKSFEGVLGDLDTDSVFVAGRQDGLDLDRDLTEMAEKAEKMISDFELGLDSDELIGVNLKKCRIAQALEIYLSGMWDYDLTDTERERFMTFLENRLVWNTVDQLNKINKDLTLMHESRQEGDTRSSDKYAHRLATLCGDQKNSWLFRVYPEHLETIQKEIAWSTL